MNNYKFISSVNLGNEFFFISNYFRDNNSSILYIARNDREIFKIKDKLKWFLPKNNILLFRSWDQIPYDNVSPSREIQSERIKSLFEIINNKDNKIVLTSVNAIIQKIIDIEFIKKNTLEISINKVINFDELIKKIILLGYQRTSLVRDKSEFAVRGSIIDIFLSHYNNPLRIDFDNNKIISIKEFDKLTQKKISNFTNNIILYPSSELLLDEKNIITFRSFT